MKKPKVSLTRALLLAAAGFVAAGVIAPFVQADRFGQVIRRALERSLNRKVDIHGPVRFNLFTGPGFSLGDVVIHEDPAVSIEPFAYVSSLETRVRLLSLLGGRLEFSNLRLVEPSVNLLKTPSGPWNIHPMLDRAFGASRVYGAPLPEIQVRSGRLNFKTGDAKSVYYFSNADIDVSPSFAGEGHVDIRFSGEPSRTDRTGQSFGTLAGGGRWTYSPEGESRVDLNLRLGRSALAEVMTLVQGRSMGLDGFVASRARLAGPVSDIQISGRLQLEEIERWYLIPSKSGDWSLEYRGRLNLIDQALALETSASESLPASIRLRATEYLTQPRWAVTVTLRELPLESVLALSRHMGFDLPANFAAAGKVTGAAGYSSGGRLQGKFALADASLSAPNAPTVGFESAQVLVDHRRIQLSPATAVLENGQSARVEARYLADARVLDLRVASRSVEIAAFEPAWRRLTGSVPPPVLEACRRGNWSGSLRYRREGDAPPEWTGRVDLEDTTIVLPGFSEPLAVASASVALRAGAIEIDGIDAAMGPVSLRGDYRWESAADRPRRFRVTVAELDAAKLERLLEPSLRRRRGFIARTLRLRPAPIPEWLRARGTEGSIQVNAFSLGELGLRRLRANVLWEGTRLQLRNIESQLDDGSLAGRASADLSEDNPNYQATVRLENARWSGGRIDAWVTLATTGTGGDLLTNLHAEGSFKGRSIRVSADQEWRAVEGCYEASWVRGVPRLQFTSIGIAMGHDVFYGFGDTAADGRLQLELFNGTKQVKIAGTIVPFQMEVLAQR